MRKFFYLLAALACANVHAQSDFDTWLAAFRAEATAQGIRPATLDAALAGVMPTERVIALDRRQPEFLQTFSDYLGRRVSLRQTTRGQARLAEHAALFDAVEQRHGVPKNILAAFWGMETNYGTTLGHLNIPASLATLAFDGRRSGFFRSQLLDALRIIDAGHVSAIDMNGSWAGAMGHMQFMPSTFRSYAMDGDGDARIDLWQSLPDAMHSAANYLRRSGWRAQEPVALEVRLPKGFDLRQARITNRLSLSTWASLGVEGAAQALPTTPLVAGMVLPQGRRGPVFLVFDNFDVVMQWNRSTNYALAVAQLAHQIAGGALLSVTTGEPGGVSTAQVQAMQRALNDMGFDAGYADGLIGTRTQTALRRYQVTHQLPADAYPSPSVIDHIGQTHADAAAAGLLVRPAAPTFAEPAVH